jgi:PPP family 3-phenylpropionic acid transporter
VIGGLASGPIWLHFGANVLYSCSAGVALLGLMLLVWKQGMTKVQRQA